MPIEQDRSQQRHEQILEAATRIFSRKGYHDAAMDDIAVESRTSKGGLYFHFPNKQTLFLALLDQMIALLRARAEAAIAEEEDPIRKAEAALRVVLHTFASHRTLAQLFLVEALAAGREFQERLAASHAAFAGLVQSHLDDAVRQGVIPPQDTALAGQVWFGALNEVVTAWLLREPPGPLEEQYPALRALLLRSVGVPPTGLVPGGPR
ncbi:MAG: TetR/AcrR family transcriptional regulator [Chloroflexota bacterium]